MFGAMFSAHLLFFWTQGSVRNLTASRHVDRSTDAKAIVVRCCIHLYAEDVKLRLQTSSFEWRLAMTHDTLVFSGYLMWRLV